MRDQLQRALAKAPGLLQGQRVVGLSSVGGGSVGSSWRVSLSDGQALFVKMACDANLQAEQAGCRRCADGPISRSKCPRCLAVFPWVSSQPW